MKHKATFIILAGALTVIALTARPPAPSLRLPDSAPVLPRARSLLALFGSHRQLLADVYWLQATYRTGIAGTASEYRDIYYYAQLITDIDPDFQYAYYFGTVVPPYNHGHETWVNTKESTAMAEKGLAKFPDDLRLRLLHAYNLSYFERDYPRAAGELIRASKLPNAPAFIGALATRMYATSDSFEAALSLTDALLAQAEDQETREFYQRRRKEILLERTLKTVDQASRQFRDRTGHPPTSLEQLLVTGDMASMPVDPFGGAIVLDEEGRSHSTAVAKRLQVFLGPMERARE